ncbi:MAG: metal ABC transporter permease, partial [candidate division KSB1 bacterium]|nr:metal ABC transporter permease [candidate division KSB1 bacterium]
MLETLKFLTPPFIAAGLIVGIHSYLGIHVLKRGIIFVDLALAQMAALGTIVGIAFGLMPGSTVSYYFSLGFVCLGAILFSITRPKDKKIPQEAIIGIIYGLSIAVAMAIADKLSSGGQHIKEILTGNLLWISWSTIARLAIVYLAIALLHVFCRSKFLTISQDYQKAIVSGLSIKLWDFLFFVSFGIVITLSVPIAGVLLVFSFLMIPAAISALFSDNWNRRIIVGWLAGVMACLLGLWYSYSQNTPCGPATVCILAIFLVLSGLLRALIL